MSTLLQLKEEVYFTGEIRSILDVMKQVAASDMKQWELKRVTHTPLLKEIENGMQLLKASGARSALWESTSTKIEAILVTSDSGFVGDLNALVARAGFKTGAERYYAVGAQGKRILEDLRMPHGGMVGLQYPLSPQQILTMTKAILEPYLNGEVGHAVLVYPKFISMSHQQVITRTILPLPPSKFKLSRRAQAVLLESPAAKLEAKLLEFWFQCSLAEIISEARLSELAARVNHLEGSLDELGTQNRNLNLQYIRAMHEEMDRTVREICASRLIKVRKS